MNLNVLKFEFDFFFLKCYSHGILKKLLFNKQFLLCACAIKKFKCKIFFKKDFFSKNEFDSKNYGNNFWLIFQKVVGSFCFKNRTRFKEENSFFNDFCNAI